MVNVDPCLEPVSSLGHSTIPTYTGACRCKSSFLFWFEVFLFLAGLRKGIAGNFNEVNLLNAKLLFANKLFRSYNLTNEQKVKVVETLDRTNSVREVKLVFSTLAESLKFNGNSKKQKLSEGIASKAQPSTAPKKEIIEESTNEMANRFKKLANII